jgi:hypothetical protein
MGVVSQHYATNTTLWVKWCQRGARTFHALLSVATPTDMLCMIVCSLRLYLILRQNVLGYLRALSAFAHALEYSDLLHHCVVPFLPFGQRGLLFDSVAGLLATYFGVWPRVWTMWPIYRHYYSIYKFATLWRHHSRHGVGT